MRVLITGGAGFIGSHIADALLAHGHEPFVLDDLSSGSRDNLLPDTPFFEADIRDREAVAWVIREVRPHAVCHQAAQVSVSRSVREPTFDADVNLVGMLNLLELSVEWEVERFVLASSGGVLYGDVHEPAGEDHPSDPRSPYGISKWASEKYLEFFYRTHGLTSAALRYANVYGQRQNPHGEAGVVAMFAQTMLAGGQATINGDGHYIRDYVYVEDIARGNLLALTRPLPAGVTPLNLGTGRGCDVNELARLMRALSQEEWRKRNRPGEIPEPVHGPPRPGDLRSSIVSAARIEALFGWKPEVTLEDGLRRTVSWFADRVCDHC